LSAAVVSTVGFIAVLRSPDVVDIPAFTVMFTSRGLSKELLIWTLLIFPTSLAFAASVWLYLGAKGRAFPLFFGWGLVGLYMYSGGVTLGLGVTQGWEGWTNVIEVGCLAGAVTALLLFPNGRWVPAWTRWACLVCIGLLIAVPEVGTNLRRLLVNADAVDADVRALALLAGTAVLAFPLVAQVIRYRRYATKTEQQQTKWISFGAGLMFAPAAIAVVLAMSFSGRHPALGWLVAVTAFAGFVIPIAAAIAITKYRLYDLDHLVSRTVSYTVVAGLVTAIFVLGVAAVQALLPEAGSLAVAASTIASVAVFSPLRRRVQSRVDRHFNRARYDSERETAAFAGRLRSSSDLDVVIRGLLDVLGKTVQPATVAIWTNEQIGARGRTRDTLRHGGKGDIRSSGSGSTRDS
jgi:hypothetical protein